MVIFGAGGDLTHRLLIPALCNLQRSGLLPEQFALIGASGGRRSTAAWTGSLEQALRRYGGDPSSETAMRFDPQAWQALAGRMTYLDLRFDQARDYKRLARLLAQTEKRHGTQGNVLFYLAAAPRFFAPIVEQLAAAGLAGHRFTQPWRRVIVEKPFGHDLASAQALNGELLRLLREDQIFRIDHFLGKETVQNIMAFRFANGLFEPVWHRDRIDHVQITAAETVGVEGRGQFYDRNGCLRDMVPNHLFQLLAMVAMEPPSSFSPDAIRSRKAEVLQAIRPPRPEDAVRGQYGRGTVLGQAVRPYREEPEVAPASGTETYVALKLAIDTWRWAGVPFYLRTGKHLTRRTTEIAIRFKPAPLAPFRDTAVDAFGPDWLVLQIQPDESIALQFDVKRPGPRVELAAARMEFRYRDWFPRLGNVGYETLLYDCMTGDATLFQRADMVEAGWKAVQPVLDAWGGKRPQGFPNYASGTAGPAAADLLLARDGARVWRPIDPALQPPRWNTP
jgi:glucose-6-phosphate 1-dehydrogenase